MRLARSMAAAKSWHPVMKAASRTQTVNAIAARLEPKARKRFLAAMKTLDTANLDALVEAIRGRDTESIARLLHVPDLGKALQPLSDLMQQGYGLSGTHGAAALSATLDVPFSFNLTSPTAINWARVSSATRVTNISDQARRTIQDVVAQGLQQGIPPIEQARLIRNVVPLTDRQAMAVINYRFDLLEAGKAADVVARMADRYATQLLNYRSKLIARTETIDASNQGLLESWNQAAHAGLINRATTQRVWIAAPDACPQICAPMDGQTVAFEGELFETGDGESVNAPPAHPACRCGVGLVL